jgi:hypothetical protein
MMLAGICGVGSTLIAAPANGKPSEKPKTSMAAKEPEAMPTISGIEIQRPNGAFLGLQIVGSNFVLTFYDSNKKKMAADVMRATLRWPVKYQPNNERTVLNPGGDPSSLTSPMPVRPPHNFKVFMSLFVEGHDDPVESYVVDYRP